MRNCYARHARALRESRVGTRSRGMVSMGTWQRWQLGIARASDLARLASPYPSAPIPPFFTKQHPAFAAQRPGEVP